MRILFSLRSAAYLRYYDETIRQLLDRDHEVILSFTRPDIEPEALDIFRSWTRRPLVSSVRFERADRYAAIATRLRATVDYVRYLDPLYARAEYLRDRQRQWLSSSSRPTNFLRRRRSLPRALVWLLIRALLALEGAVPSSTHVESSLRALEPDVVLVSPLVAQGRSLVQVDILKSALALGIPCGACIASWDNLTNKGLLRVIPDRVMLWNVAQREEAEKLHGVPRERIVITGAQPFDRWFGRRPERSRRAFCTELGLSPDRPIVLFLGSSRHILSFRDEDAVIEEWVGALRRSDGTARASIVIRRHPDRMRSGDGAVVASVPDATVWPAERRTTVGPEVRDDLFDSLYHSDAVVGVNTSAMIEAATIGRPVLTFELPGLDEGQAGTLHFQHMLPKHGGFLRVASSMAEHACQLGQALDDPGSGAVARRRFVAHFIRPFGEDEPATPRLVDAIESLGRPGSQPTRPSSYAPLLRPILWPLLGREWWQRSSSQHRELSRLGGRALWSLAQRVTPFSPRLGKHLRRTAKRVKPGAPALGAASQRRKKKHR